MKTIIITRHKNKADDMRWVYSHNDKPCTIETINDLVKTGNNVLNSGAIYTECRIRLNFKMETGKTSVTFEATDPKATEACQNQNLNEIASATLILTQK